jgi:UDP:flavonoid glycosyltransferase YjiC (YdhE family)
MARIIVSTFGSTGDLNPFIALGSMLRERGHEVVFARAQAELARLIQDKRYLAQAGIQKRRDLT